MSVKELLLNTIRVRNDKSMLIARKPSVASVQTRWVVSNMQIGAATCYEHMISNALDFNNRRSGRDKSLIGPPAREIDWSTRSRSPRAGVQSARVEPNLETATYNDRGLGQRKFGGVRARTARVYLEITSVYLRLHLPASTSPSNLTAHQFVI